jgi:hypothetical protein
MSYLPDLRKLTDAELEAALAGAIDPKTRALAAEVLAQGDIRLSGVLADGQLVLAIIGNGGQAAEMHFVPFTAKCLRLVKFAPYLAGMCGAEAFFTHVLPDSPAAEALTRVLLKEGWEAVPEHEDYFMQLYDM